MKKLEKMSLANVRSKLTRKEMSNIMAGSGSWSTPECGELCSTDSFCSENTSCSCCIRGKCA